MLAEASAFLGYFRWLFMPLGIFSLVAIGVHAAADTVDDRIRFLVEQGDAWLDGLLGGVDRLHRYVDAVGAEERTALARGLTLGWELLVDLFVALPALGYAERRASGAAPLHGAKARGWRELLRSVVREPTTLRLLRPLATAALVLAGACAVGRTVQSALYVSLQSTIASGLAGSLARLFAVAAIAGVLASFGGRAVLRNLQAADNVAEEDRKKGRAKAHRFSRGLLGTALVIPLAVAAFLDASPLLSFVR